MAKNNKISAPVSARVTTGRFWQPRPVPATLMYDPQDPFAVTLELPLRVDKPDPTQTARWAFGRALLAAGRLGAEGPGGDVLVAPAGDPTDVRIELRSPGGQAVLWVPAEQVRQFLAASYQLVPVGTESKHIDWDPFLAEVLGGTRP